MLETELQQFQAIIGGRTAARLELDRALIRGHVPERCHAVESYVRTLDKCIAELEAWSTTISSRINHNSQEGKALPMVDDPCWELLRTTGVASWIASLRQERELLVKELAALDELNRFPHDL